MLLHEDTLALTHPLFGTIRLNEKFQKVLKLDPFVELGFKSQLGTFAYLGSILNAKHTRLMHSVGVMFLVDKLLDTIQRKYSKVLTITQEDRETLELVALGHDIGHLAFSHSLENKSLKSHEERTVELFENYANEINSIFGYDITSKVLKVFEFGKDSYRASMLFGDGIDILTICTPLLMGTIDCDRMEYLMTDRYMLTGDHIDYTRIFESIAIVKYGYYGSYAIAFEKSALSLIEDMLMTRVHQYENVYCTMEDTITKSILKNYVLASGIENSNICTMQEYDFLSHMHNVLRKGVNGSIQSHLAKAFLYSNHENILCKKFTNVKAYEYFTNRLYEITDRRDVIVAKWYEFNAYSKDKDFVLIKDNDGTTKNLEEINSKIMNCVAEFGYVIVDVDWSYELKKEDTRKIRQLFAM